MMMQLPLKQLHLLGWLLLTFTASQWQFDADAFASLRPSFMPKRSRNCGLSFEICRYNPIARFPSLALSKSSFMDRLHGESDDAYFKRILAVASDAKTFENAVIRQPNTAMIQDSTSSFSSNTSSSEISSSQVPKKGGYVRAEDWEAEERRKAKNASSWEDWVQFDGQMHGNRFSQNEILRHHLKGF
jgi:hypothetical protein